MKIILITTAPATVREVWEFEVPPDFVLDVSSRGHLERQLAELLNDAGAATEAWKDKTVFDKGVAEVIDWQVSTE